ncbi:ABC transporter permease [Aerococcaceae bacterium zg-B36]|uniref:ABC transporter permease n=1 Tax=Aerococcaceae bacterium zg-252 TaxID=2796928 RepID=UPI001BD86E65|nr:ABC transporter permease [Aerococcaceae bacterium zg-B36]
MYYLWTATQNVMSQKKFYLLFCLQIVLITCLINVLLGLNNGLQQMITTFSTQRQFDVLYLNGENADGVVFNDFTLDDFQELQPLFPTIPMSLVKTGVLGIFNDDLSVKSYHYYEVTGSFEELALSETVNLDLEQYIYASMEFFKELEQVLKSMPSNVTAQEFDIADISLEEMWLMTGTGQKIPIYPLENVSNSQNIQIIFGNEINLHNLEENTHPLMKSIIASSKWHILGGAQHSISLGMRVNQEQTKELQQILSYNNQKHSDYLFKYSSLKQEFNDKRQEIVLISRTFNSILFVCVVIIGISLVGLVSTFIDRRKGNISLCFLVGATKKELLIELLLELILVVLVSSMIGIVSSYAIVLFNGNMLGVPINLSFGYCLLLILCQFIMTLFITVLLAKKYTKMNPIAILSEV